MVAAFGLILICCTLGLCHFAIIAVLSIMLQHYVHKLSACHLFPSVQRKLCIHPSMSLLISAEHEVSQHPVRAV